MRLRLRSRAAAPCTALAVWIGCAVEPGEGLLSSSAPPVATGWSETTEAADDVDVDTTSPQGETSIGADPTSTGDPTTGTVIGTESTSSLGDDGVHEDSGDSSGGALEPAPATVDAMCSDVVSPHAAEPQAAAAELHLFAAYTATDGQIVISLLRTDVPLVLSLSAYEPTTWSIEREAGVELEAVVVSGYGAQQIEGLDGAVLIDASGAAAGPACTPTQWPADADCDATVFAQWAELQTGASLTTFSGCYEATSFALH